MSRRLKAVVDDLGELTEREHDVLELVAGGFHTHGIARRLYVTEDTVKTHLKRIMVKTGARTRAHAVAISFRKGWIK